VLGLEPPVKIEYDFTLPNGDKVIVYKNYLGYCIFVVIDTEGKTVAIAHQ
jgi:hypothetical protein